MNIYRGWEIYERGIYDLCIDIRDNYGNIESFISENGMGVANEERFLNEEGQIQDDYRIQFVKDHLAYVHQAIAEGCDIKGTTYGRLLIVGLGLMHIKTVTDSFHLMLKLANAP